MGVPSGPFCYPSIKGGRKILLIDLPIITFSWLYRFIRFPLKKTVYRCRFNRYIFENRCLPLVPASAIILMRNYLTWKLGIQSYAFCSVKHWLRSGMDLFYSQTVYWPLGIASDLRPLFVSDFQDDKKKLYFLFVLLLLSVFSLSVLKDKNPLRSH